MTMLPNLFKKISTRKLRTLSMNKPITQASKQHPPPPKVQTGVTVIKWQSMRNTIDSMTLTYHTHLTI